MSDLPRPGGPPPDINPRAPISRTRRCSKCRKYLFLKLFASAEAKRCIKCEPLQEDKLQNSGLLADEESARSADVRVLRARITSAMQREYKLNAKFKRWVGEHTITMSYMIDLFIKQRGRCALSGRKMTLSAGLHNTYYVRPVTEGDILASEMLGGRKAAPRKIRYDRDCISVDRIDPHKGYIEGNVRFVTWQVNISKWLFTDDQFLSLAREIVRYQDWLTTRENSAINSVPSATAITETPQT